MAGALIRALGAPVALLFTASLLLLSALILSFVRIEEKPTPGDGRFWSELQTGLRFVRQRRVLVVLGGFVAAWQFFYNAAIVVTILFATRTLRMSAQSVGLSYVFLGVGTVFASLIGQRLGRRLGPGSCLTVGFGLCSCSWLMLTAAPASASGVALFACSLTLFGLGALLIFINFIALRQSVTPAPMLGRMTSTMRWLILIPAVPGALLGGWLGEHGGLRVALGFAGVGAAVLTLVACRSTVLRALRALPAADAAEGERATECLRS